jgi:hypothetical protein
MSGWECPKCHRCYAPFVPECKACNDATQTTAPSYPCPVWRDHWMCQPSGTLTVTNGAGVVVPYSRQ